MIKPYYKEDHENVSLVEVEDYGIINLNDLPIQVDLNKEGFYEIIWAKWSNEGHVLSHVGGKNMMSFGGCCLGVIKEIE